MFRFACVVSRFNEEVTLGLLAGARQFLHTRDIPLQEADIFYAPGAFEIPLIAQKLAQTKKYDGIICLGCVIKGDTAHFEFISLGVTTGIMQSMLQTNTPIALGVLTTYTEAQAMARSQLGPTNKGWEAAAACFETVHTLSVIEDLREDFRPENRKIETHS